MVVGDLGDDGAQVAGQGAVEIPVPANVFRGDRTVAEGEKRLSEMHAGDFKDAGIYPVVGDVSLGARGAANETGLECRYQLVHRAVGKDPARNGHGPRDGLHGPGAAQLGDLVLAGAAQRVPHHLDGFLASNDEQVQALDVAQCPAEVAEEPPAVRDPLAGLGEQLVSRVDRREHLGASPVAA